MIRGLDYDKLWLQWDRLKYSEYPDYLYNDNLFDDVTYLLNKSIFLQRTMNVLNFTRSGNKTTTFDVYSNWNDSFTFGAETVLNSYSLGPAADSSVSMSEKYRRIILENIRYNVTDLADEYPGTTFYLFFTPYSICWWDIVNNEQKVNFTIDCEQIAIEEILKHPNIRLHCFYTNFEMICDLDNYKDLGHYGEWINSWMLEQMYNGNYLLTEDNYMEHLAAMHEFYNSYDYASLHGQ